MNALTASRHGLWLFLKPAPRWFDPLDSCPYLHCNGSGHPSAWIGSSLLFRRRQFAEAFDDIGVARGLVCSLAHVLVQVGQEPFLVLGG
jgi:hypothetical protein